MNTKKKIKKKPVAKKIPTKLKKPAATLPAAARRPAAADSARPAASSNSDSEPPGGWIELTHWPMPATPEEMMKWSDFVLLRMADLMGKDQVQKKLKTLRTVYSFFAGIDCQRFAWKMITGSCERLWGFRPMILFDSAVEKKKNKQDMMIAWHQRSSSCVFGDILDMISNKVSENDLLDPKKITWKRTAWCAKHQKECLVWHPEPNQYGLGVWAKCRLFSTMGNNDGSTNVEVIESVPQFDEVQLRKAGLMIERAQLTPQMFGMPCTRDRDYRITWDPEVMRWTLVSFTCQDLADALLFPNTGERCKLKPADLLVSDEATCPHIYREADLTRTQSTHLDQYRALFPEQKFYSLSQSPEKVKRTEDRLGSLLTLTTNMDLWSEEKKRLVTPEELFLSMGLPSSGAIVEPLWVAPMNVDPYGYKQLEHCAGNTMCVPAIGFAMLVAALALEPIVK